MNKHKADSDFVTIAMLRSEWAAALSHLMRVEFLALSGAAQEQLIAIRAVIARAVEER